MLSCNSAASTLYTHVNQLPSMDSVSSVSSHSHDVTANCGVIVPPAAAAKPASRTSKATDTEKTSARDDDMLNNNGPHLSQGPDAHLPGATPQTHPLSP